MTDRERLEQMAKEREEGRTKEATERQRKETERLQSQQEKTDLEKQKTEELRTYCEATFKGFKLTPTGHEVGVDTAAVSTLHNLASDGVEYVQLYITHWGKETGNFQGRIPILLCRFKDGRYEAAVGTEATKRMNDNLDDFKESLLRAVAGMGSAELLAIFKKLKAQLGR